MDKLNISSVSESPSQARQARKKHLADGMEGDATIQVKGGMVADLVHLIRSNPDKSWGQYLKAQDWELINGTILSSEWYPLGPFRRMGAALFKEVAGSDRDRVRAFGRAGAERFLSIYQNIIVPGDPIQSLNNLIYFKDLFVRGDFRLEENNAPPNQAQIFLYQPAEIPETYLFKAFCYLLAGVEEAIVLLAGGRAVSSRVDSKPGGWAITLSWELHPDRPQARPPDGSGNIDARAFAVKGIAE